MASLTQWTWIRANPGKQWRTGEPGVLQSTGSQRDGHDLVTEQQQRMPSSALFTQKYTVILFSCQSICTLKSFKMPAPFFGYMYTIINLIISTWRSFSFIAFTKQCWLKCQVRNLILLTSSEVSLLLCCGCWQKTQDTRIRDKRLYHLYPPQTAGASACHSFHWP